MRFLTVVRAHELLRAVADHAHTQGLEAQWLGPHNLTVKSRTDVPYRLTLERVFDAVHTAELTVHRSGDRVKLKLADAPSAHELTSALDRQWQADLQMSELRVPVKTAPRAGGRRDRAA